MGNKFIEVPLIPGDKIYYRGLKDEIMEYTVKYILIGMQRTFIEIEGNFDFGEEVGFSVEDIGKIIFLNRNDAKTFLESK